MKPERRHQPGRQQSSAGQRQPGGGRPAAGHRPAGGRPAGEPPEAGEKTWAPTQASRSFPSARTPECRELLDRSLAGLGLDGTGFPGLARGLDTYLKEIELWNPRLGLVEAGGPDLIIRHLLDSLAPWALFHQQVLHQSARCPGQPVRLADLGSGGGFPALPLALALADTGLAWTMDLYERQERRAVFLRNCLVLLGLRDRVQVCQTTLAGMDRPTLEGPALAETGNQDTRPAGSGAYHLVTARAFRPLDALVLPAMRAMLAPEGLLFLYKGRLDGIREELDRVGQPAAQVVPVALDGLAEERHIVLLGN